MRRAGMLTVVVALMVALTASVAVAKSFHGNAKNDTIRGTGKADVIRGQGRR